MGDRGETQPAVGQKKKRQHEAAVGQKSRGAERVGVGRGIGGTASDTALIRGRAVLANVILCLRGV